jgi:hypothetical protein
VPSSSIPTHDGGPPIEELGVPSIEDVQAAFATAGLRVTVEERTLALTASADGGILIGIFIGAPLPEFARLFTDDTYAALKRLLRRYRRHDAVEYALYVSDGSVDAQIDADLPPEAFLKLQGILPISPSGRIIYNRAKRRWEDSGRG